MTVVDDVEVDDEGRGSLLQRRRDRKDARQRERMAKIRAKSGNRYRIHYDIDGPRVRLGVAWFAVVMLAAYLGHVGLGLVYGVCAAAAAAHAARTWRVRGANADNLVAFAAAGGLVAASIVHPRVFGAAIIVVVAVFAVVSFGSRGGDAPAAIADTGILVQACVPVAFAAGCLVLLADLHLGAAVTLILAMSAYESGDYLIGSGAPNPIEGPVAGMLAAFVVALVVYFPGVPPFEDGWQALGFGAVAAVGAVGGQYLGSVILPHSRAYAPALRRLDSMLLVAPLWYGGVDLFVL